MQKTTYYISSFTMLQPKSPNKTLSHNIFVTQLQMYIFFTHLLVTDAAGILCKSWRPTQWLTHSYTVGLTTLLHESHLLLPFPFYFWFWNKFSENTNRLPTVTTVYSVFVLNKLHESADSMYWIHAHTHRVQTHTYKTHFSFVIINLMCLLTCTWSQMQTGNCRNDGK